MNEKAGRRVLGRQVAVELPQERLEQVQGGTSTRETGGSFTEAKTCDVEVSITPTGKDCATGWDDWAGGLPI